MVPPWCSGKILGLELRGTGSILTENTIGIRQKSHPKFKVLHCSKKSSLVQKGGGGRHLQNQQRLSSQMQEKNDVNRASASSSSLYNIGFNCYIDIGLCLLFGPFSDQ